MTGSLSMCGDPIPRMIPPVSVYIWQISDESWSLILQSQCISLQKSELGTGWWMKMKRKTPPGGRVFRKPAPGGVLREAVRCAILMQMFYGGYA